MNLRKLQFLVGVTLSSIITVAAPTGTTAVNPTVQKNWKSVQMTPDLDKDGKNDILVIEYIEESDKIYTRFTPYIKDENNKTVKGQTTEKIFERNVFQKEFNKYSKEYVRKYPKKTKNNIISNEKVNKPVNSTQPNNQNKQTEKKDILLFRLFKIKIRKRKIE